MYLALGKSYEGEHSCWKLKLIVASLSIDNEYVWKMSFETAISNLLENLLLFLEGKKININMAHSFYILMHILAI